MRKETFYKMTEFTGTVLAPVAVIIAASGWFAGDIIGSLRNMETLLALISVLIAAIAGFFSAYISRAAKKLYKHQRVFLSYSRYDVDVVRKLAEELREQGARVWFDEDSLHAGDELRSSIRSAIESSNRMIFITSKSSGSNVDWEVKTAAANNVPVVVVALPGTETPGELADAHRIDLRPTEKGLRETAIAALHA